MTRQTLNISIALGLSLLASSCGSGLAAAIAGTDSSSSDPPDFRVQTFTPAGFVEALENYAEPVDFLQLSFNRAVSLNSLKKPGAVRILVDDATSMDLEDFADLELAGNSSVRFVLKERLRIDSTYLITLTKKVQAKGGDNLGKETRWDIRVRTGNWGDREVVSLLVPSSGTRMLPGRARTTILEGLEADYNGNTLGYQTASIDAAADNGPWTNPEVFHISPATDQNSKKLEPRSSGYEVSSAGPRLYAFVEGLPKWTDGNPNGQLVRFRASTRFFQDGPDHELWENDPNDTDRALLLDDGSSYGNLNYVPWPGQFRFTEAADAMDVDAAAVWWAWTIQDGTSNEVYRVRCADRSYGEPWEVDELSDPNITSFYSWPLMETLSDGTAIAIWWEANNQLGVFAPEPPNNLCKNSPQPTAFWVAEYVPGSGWSTPAEAEGPMLGQIHRLTSLRVSMDGKYLVAVGRATAGAMRDQGPLAYVQDRASETWSGPYPFDAGGNTRLSIDEIRYPDWYPNNNNGEQNKIRNFVRGGSPSLTPAPDGTMFVTWQSGTPSTSACQNFQDDVDNVRLYIGRFDPAKAVNMEVAWSNTNSLANKGANQTIMGGTPFIDHKGTLTAVWGVQNGGYQDPNSFHEIRWNQSTDGGETWNFPWDPMGGANDFYDEKYEEVLEANGYPFCLSGPGISGDPGSGQVLISWNETNCDGSPSATSYTLTFR